MEGIAKIIPKSKHGAKNLHLSKDTRSRSFDPRAYA
ncbi:uncharacterized protein J3R85_002120 [Psidium guajava]|nr:uncharacterized protein J3R85_002120 [Psidium guajava]